MVRIRIIEERLAEVYPAGEMRTPTHFSIGQEAIAVGVCAALEQADVIFSGHRCHAHYLAKGGNLHRMVDELFGRETGCCRGRGGSVHLRDVDAGVVASSAILGETLAVAAGRALAFSLDQEPRVAAVFFGDACTEEGIFSETLNIAALHRLPLLLVCENNGYSTNTPLPQRQPEAVTIAARARAAGISTLTADGNDVLSVYQTAQQAVAQARAKVPTLVELSTYRWREHVGPLWDYPTFRSEEEVRTWQTRCPIALAKQTLAGQAPEALSLLEGFAQQCQQEIDEAIQHARVAPWPSPDEMLLGATSWEPTP